MPDFPKTKYVPLASKIIDHNLSQRVLYEKLHTPIAYAEIIDEDGNTVNLVTCESFRLNMVKGSFYNRFELNLLKASSWNPRSLYADLVSPNNQKRIKVYYGQRFGLDTVYEQIVLGIPNQTPEQYEYGSSDIIQVSCVTLGYILDTIEGNYVVSVLDEGYESVDSEDVYSGSTQALFEHWLDRAGLSYSLEYDDYIVLDDESIAFVSAMSGISTYKQMLGPSVELFSDCDGLFHVRNVRKNTYEDAEFVYNDSNVMALKLSTRIPTTVVVISGFDDDSSIELSADDYLIERYGRNRYNISSSYITTLAAATQLAEDVLRYLGYTEEYQIRAPFNPYIRLGSQILLDSAYTKMEDIVIQVDSYSHNYVRGQTQETNIKGHIVE